MNFQPMPLTVGNAKLLQEWQDKLSAFIASKARDRVLESITEMYAEDKRFAELVDQAIANGGDYESIDIQDWAKDNIALAMKFRQNLNTLPHSIAGLNIGIECIKATADKTQLPAEDAANFDNADFWLHVSMSDVQKYCHVIMDMK